MFTRSLFILPLNVSIPLSFLLLRLVRSLAALPIQVQVPAWTGRGCWHPAGRNAAVRTQERTPGQPPDYTESAPDHTPKSRRPRKQLLDQPGVLLPSFLPSILPSLLHVITCWNLTRDVHRPPPHLRPTLHLDLVDRVSPPLHQDTLNWPGRSPGSKGKSHFTYITVHFLMSPVHVFNSVKSFM